VSYSATRACGGQIHKKNNKKRSSLLLLKGEGGGVNKKERGRGGERMALETKALSLFCNAAGSRKAEAKGTQEIKLKFFR
jgi:hypothetical protein